MAPSLLCFTLERRIPLNPEGINPEPVCLRVFDLSLDDGRVETKGEGDIAAVTTVQGSDLTLR